MRFGCRVGVIWVWLCVWKDIWVAGQIKHKTYERAELTNMLPDGTVAYQENSIIRCSIRCLMVQGCWMLLFSEEAKVCTVATSDSVNSVSTLLNPSLVYIPLRPRHIVIVYHELMYDDARAFCRGYGGKLHTPRTQEEVTFLDGREMDGYLGLREMSSGNWVDDDGATFTTTLWHGDYPTNNGPCARVKDAKIVDCSCDQKIRNFVCEFGSN